MSIDKHANLPNPMVKERVYSHVSMKERIGQLMQKAVLLLDYCNSLTLSDKQRLHKTCFFCKSMLNT